VQVDLLFSFGILARTDQYSKVLGVQPANGQALVKTEADQLEITARQQQFDFPVLSAGAAPSAVPRVDWTGVRLVGVSVAIDIVDDPLRPALRLPAFAVEGGRLVVVLVFGRIGSGRICFFAVVLAHYYRTGQQTT